MAPDTSYRRSFNDYVFFNEDINATWLGISGSPVQLYDWFKRTEEANAIFYTPYSIWNYTPENLPQYNTKTPYTELAYYGTLFANQEKEEANVRVLTTQNITPALNMTLEFRRYGGNGMLKREDTANKSFVAATNYLGKKYMMHAGYIYNKIHRSENVKDFYEDACNELKKARALPRKSNEEKEIRSDAIKNARVKKRSSSLMRKYGIENIKAPDEAVKEEIVNRDAKNFFESMKIKRELNAYAKAVSVYTSVIKPYTDAKNLIEQAENYTHYEELEQRYLQMVN